MTRILILDNDAALRDLLKLAFSRVGADVHLAATPEEAQARLAKGEADAVLVDLHLGGGHSGADCVRDWAELGILVPFWMVTGTPDDPMTAGLSEVSCYQGIIAKPFSILKLTEEVMQGVKS